MRKDFSDAVYEKCGVFFGSAIMASLMMLLVIIPASAVAMVLLVLIATGLQWAFGP